jgi:hypothetical protein
MRCRVTKLEQISREPAARRVGYSDRSSSSARKTRCPFLSSPTPSSAPSTPTVTTSGATLAGRKEQHIGWQRHLPYSPLQEPTQLRPNRVKPGHKVVMSSPRLRFVCELLIVSLRRKSRARTLRVCPNGPGGHRFDVVKRCGGIHDYHAVAAHPINSRCATRLNGRSQTRSCISCSPRACSAPSRKRSCSLGHGASSQAARYCA